MRPSLLRFVKPRRPVRKTAPVLPPLQLYREILRAHRRLPQLLRHLGDAYVRLEFKAHKDIDNPLHIIGFLTSWQDYLSQIKGDDWMKFRLKQEDLDKMSPEQVTQLYELMKETQKYGRELFEEDE